MMGEKTDAIVCSLGIKAALLLILKYHNRVEIPRVKTTREDALFEMWYR